MVGGGEGEAQETLGAERPHRQQGFLWDPAVHLESPPRPQLLTECRRPSAKTVLGFWDSKQLRALASWDLYSGRERRSINMIQEVTSYVRGGQPYGAGRIENGEEGSSQTGRRKAEAFSLNESQGRCLSECLNEGMD